MAGTEERVRIIDKVNEADKLVLKFFNGDRGKTDLWFETNNPLLGNVRPAGMAIWEPDKLLKFIKESLLENKPPTDTENGKTNVR